nr:DUF302 domain-containing protein [Nocardia mexicana]
MEPSPAIAVLLDTPFAETVSLTREALRQQGFDVIAEVDMRATLRKELGEQVEEYLILGVCNPRLASRALAEDRQAGLLLPGNVVVRTVDSGTMVEAADPDVLVRATGHHGLYPVADEARRLLVAAIEALRAPTAHSQHGT